MPLLAFAGGADPQDPASNLADLERHFPDSRIVVFPHLGHEFSGTARATRMLADFVARGTTRGLDTTSCVREVVGPRSN